MNLHTLTQTISSTTGHDWHDCFIETNAAPIKVLIADLSIRLVSGAEHNANFKEAWANNFADPMASSDYVEVHLNGAAVDALVLVSVDGGRCLIPMPQSQSNLSISRYHYAIALAFNDQTVLDRYLVTASIVVI